MEGGGLRVVVPNPNMNSEQYFGQDLGEEEEEEIMGEEEKPWKDGTVVQMLDGSPGVLYSCEAEAFGGLIVEDKIGKEEEEERQGGESTMAEADAIGQMVASCERQGN